MKFVIIDGGVIGTAVARELAGRKAGEIVILEKEPSLGRHASGRNSGVLHSGINQKPGSLKARMCVRGSRLMREHCRKRGVPMRECGTLVIARNPAESKTLGQLLEMGKACEVPNLTMLTEAKLKHKEPLCKGQEALFSPTGASVDSLALLESLAGEARDRGVVYRMGIKVSEIEGMTLATTEGLVEADYLVNCAGLYADRIAHRTGIGNNYQIIPFRGEYREVLNCDVRSMIYRAPDLRYPFLSIHLTRETDGRVLAGPTADIAFGREAYRKEWHPGEAAEMILSRQFRKLISDSEFIKLVRENILLSLSPKAFLREIQTLVSGVTMKQIHPYRSGIRAQLVDQEGKMVMDMLVEQSEKALHVLNAVSPGMTCALAFAEYAVDRILGITHKG